MVLSDKPVVAAIARSAHCGWQEMIRSAAAARSGCETGRPCITLAWTTTTKAGVLVAVQQSRLDLADAVQHGRPDRRTPSITCMDGR